MADNKSILEKAASVLTAIAALFAVVFQLKQNPWLAKILVAVALLLAISVFLGPAIHYFRSSRLRARRNKFARAQFLELSEFVKRFAKFVDSGDGKNLRNVVYYACSIKGDPLEFDLLYSADYLKEIFPHFFSRFKRLRRPNETEFYAVLEEFYALSASYNNNYILEPFRRMEQVRWPPPNPIVQSAPKLTLWLDSLPPNYQVDTKKKIEDFRERWVSYLDDLVSFLEKIKDYPGLEKMPVFFERPKKL